MALFTDNRELSRQAHTNSLEKVKGADKTALSVLGYKSDGTLNPWGNLISGGLTNKIASNIAGDTNTGRTLKAGQEEANMHSLNKLALAANLATMGGSTGAMKALSGGINMLKGGGSSDLVSGLTDMVKKKEILDELNNGGSPAQNDAPVEDVAGGMPPAEDAIEADGIVSKGKDVLNMPGVGNAIESGIGAIMSGVAYDKALVADTDGEKSMNTFNYL
jgi:hypothetical protein